MTAIAIMAGAFAAGALAIQILACALAFRRCRLQPGPVLAAPLPPATLLRPVCGVDHAAAATLGSSFTLDHPDYEIVFCVSDADDPAIPLLESLRDRHREIPCRILVGRAAFPRNPKLDNCAKGWDAALHDWIVMADSNIQLPRDYFARIAAVEGPGVGLVSAPPAGGDPKGFWAEVECAVLNTYQARIQYAVDTLGLGFAQGKTLSVRRSLLARAGGYPTLANDAAEDAAATKAIRGLGLRIRLAGPPCTQPLGRRRLRDVWARQLRWARLRRASFPLLFLPEILSGGLLPFVAAVVAASAMAVPVVPVALAWLAVWYGAEAVLARAARWPLGPVSPLAWLVRDLAIPVVWTAAWMGTSFSWRGSRLSADTAKSRISTMTIATHFAVECDNGDEDATRLSGGAW